MVTCFKNRPKQQKKNSKITKSILKKQKNLEYLVCLQKDKFLKNAPKNALKKLDILPECGEWMMEIIPKKPFEGFLSFEEIREHLQIVDSINSKNKKEINGKSLNDKIKKTFILSKTVFPKLGYADYYIRPNGESIPYFQRKNLNFICDSLYLIDETISKHSRFPALIKSMNERRGTTVEMNIPLFRDKNTRFACDGLYFETNDYKSVPYKFEEKIKKCWNQKLKSKVIFI